MVYCGKPSKGCEPCRERKTRCDKATPSCSQCIRARRTCPGYRSQLDLMFRIQNDNVVKKSEAKARGKAVKMMAKPHPPAQIHGAEEEEFDDAALEDAVISFSRQHLEFQGPWVLAIPSYTLSPTTEQRARGWFQTHSEHWLRDTDILDTIVSQTQGDEHLLASMYAVGLASFSNHMRSPELKSRATKGYVTALKLTNAALKSPTDAKKDSTLFTIMILGIYETVAGTNAQSVLAWTAHISGSAALLDYRGVEQFNSEAGQRLFYQVISNIMMSCIQRTVAIPQRIVDLRNSAANITITSCTRTWVMTGVIIDFCSFRADVCERRLTDPQEIVERALEIDHRFVEAFSDPCAAWKYEAIFTNENPHLNWDRAYHRFNHNWAAPIWNGMRTCRIMLHTTIHEQLLASSSAFTPAEADAQESSSASVRMDLGRDVMRSVPQPRTTESATQPRSLLAGTHHASIIWPLYLVGNMDVCTEGMKDWVVNRLLLMSDDEGIKQAGVVARYLDERSDFFDRRPPWKPPMARQWEEEPRITEEGS